MQHHQTSVTWVVFLSCILLLGQVPAFVRCPKPTQIHVGGVSMQRCCTALTSSSSSSSSPRSSSSSPPSTHRNPPSFVLRRTFGLLTSVAAFFLAPTSFPPSSPSSTSITTTSSWSAQAADATDLQDLSAPTPAEKEAARVKAKLKRQQEALIMENAAKGGGDEKNYGDSLKREREKQRMLKKDAKQRRQDLCEQLGRGC
ncbi:hypothetical protein NGA_0349102 [Nannochloropsis gaditana CCMP526]|uniref:uncharacterized protein n=1 Tax=Nannochloropsis gaditana (strain CCMP526) TaxID=1093141 RepID=UPI00029F6D6C|nr:hypothetical protein NGA_0349102 [Nannochloropsis gaditana CCMP526]EKU21658.1 hypothetical protein NGA_0349102 [Nannochloropsis gaditana CCMP526]|eukprot:XP_005854702.1 hypothetical protein NGA_0349102 [Nannochloropsis gaditana CCMP526]